MKRKNILYTLFTALLVVFLTSCQKEELVGGTATKDMAGDWFVQLDGEGDYYHFSTYNTAANSPTEMWIDDLETFWPGMKGKVTINQSNLTFSGANVANNYYESTFTLTDGVVLKKAAKGPSSKTVTDSISFKVTFSDDDPLGTVYTLSGYKRTGFLEDEH